MLRWFVRGVPSAAIARETRLERKRVLRALTVVRQTLARSPVLEARRDEMRPAGSEAPVLGLSIARGSACATVLPEAEAETVRRTLREAGVPLRVERLPYGAVAYRGRFYRLASSSRGGASARFGELEGFWGYIRQQLRSTGGIRRERLGLYLAEYAWRYNHRGSSQADQVRELMTLLYRAAQRWT